MQKHMKQAESSSCPEHQRLWLDKYVDKNLKDEWLERLNNLKTLNLISICEGHSDHPKHYYPRMNLRIKAELLGHVADEWKKLKPAFILALDRCFPHEDTNPSIELFRRIQRQDKDLEIPDDDIIVYIHSRISRNTVLEKEFKDNWFECSIAGVLTFDESIKAIAFEGRSPRARERMRKH